MSFIVISCPTSTAGDSAAEGCKPAAAPPTVDTIGGPHAAADAVTTALAPAAVKREGRSGGGGGGLRAAAAPPLETRGGGGGDAGSSAGGVKKTAEGLPTLKPLSESEYNARVPVAEPPTKPCDWLFEGDEDKGGNEDCLAASSAPLLLFGTLGGVKGVDVEAAAAAATAAAAAPAFCRSSSARTMTTRS
jgi:hypothetical protein